MSNYSFYGGRKGESFVIVARYDTINDMVAVFEQGNNDLSVNYGEYVIIDTANKNDPDNGKIFRRGINYNEDMGGAEYVGQVCGPSGLAPMLELTTYADAEGKQAGEGYGYRKSYGAYDTKNCLVPGKVDKQEKWNDEIKWYVTSIRDEFNRDTTAYLGFIFPYLVIDFESETVDPYYNRSTEDEKFINERLVDRMDDLTHPYWEKWHISVPKGIKGDTLKNFRIVQPSEDDNVEHYEGQDQDRENKTSLDPAAQTTRQILVYDYYHYDKDPNGEPVSLYLGDYNMIDSIVFDEEGSFTVHYSHDDDLYLQNWVKWVDHVQVSPETGLFEMFFNYETDPRTEQPTKYEMYLDWVKKVEFAEDGTVTLTYTHRHDGGDNPDIYKNLIKWIKDIQLNTENGEFDITYNYGDGDEENNTHYHKDLTWLKDLYVDDEGSVHYTYTTEEDNHVEDHQIKWIESVTLNPNNGDFDVVFNYGDEDPEASTHVHADLTWVKDVSADDEGTVTFTYTDQPDKVYTNLIKWIKEVTLNSDNGDFDIVFNYGDGDETHDTHYHADLTWVRNVTVDDDGTITFYYTDKDNLVYKNILKWIDHVSLDPETGHFTIVYNYGEDEQGHPTQYDLDLTWVKEVQLAEDGTVSVTRTTDSYDLDQKIKWIKKIELNDKGTLTVTYNDDTTDIFGNIVQWITSVELTPEGHFVVSYNNGTAAYETDLVWIADVTLDDDGTITFIENNGSEHLKKEKYLKHLTDIKIDANNGEGNQKVHVTYNTGDEEDIGEALNYIMDVQVDPKDFHLIIYHSDPAIRMAAAEEGLTREYDGKEGWIDLGAVKDEDGILVGLNIDSSKVDDFEQATVIEYLNTTYPTGLEEAGLKGKIASAGPEGGDKLFYAFDYATSEWYYLGTFNADIRIDEDGTVHIGPEGMEIRSYPQLMKWIESVSLDDTGLLTMNWNNGTEPYTKQIRWVKDVVVDEKAVTKVYYSDGTEETHNNWIEGLLGRVSTFATESEGPSEDLSAMGVWYVVDE